MGGTFASLWRRHRRTFHRRQPPAIARFGVWDHIGSLQAYLDASVGPWFSSTPASRGRSQSPRGGLGIKVRKGGCHPGGGGRKRVPDREEPGKTRKDARRGRCHLLEAGFWPLWMTPLPRYPSHQVTKEGDPLSNSHSPSREARLSGGLANGTSTSQSHCLWPRHRQRVCWPLPPPRQGPSLLTSTSYLAPMRGVACRRPCLGAQLAYT